MMRRTLALLTIFLLLLPLAACKTPSEVESVQPDDLVYFILTDRFFDGDPDNNFAVDKDDPLKRHGGDFKGVTQQLDYLQDVGATALWLTPVQENIKDGYHGYWINDFYAIDPHLGTMEDLQDLVKEAHKRGIKIILDFVVNHTGYDADLYREKKEAGWFHEDKPIPHNPSKEQEQEGWLSGLPDFDQSHPEVKKYLIDSALWLIENSGCDGFRVDTVKHVPKEFWLEFNAAIKEKYPDFYLVGEVWNYQPAVMSYYQDFGFDGLLNYPLWDAIQQSFKYGDDAKKLKEIIQKDQDTDFRKMNLSFIDNHDNPRFFQADDPYGTERLEQALAFILSYDNIPCIYYGTEIRMTGGEDPDNRRDMRFESDEYSLTTEEEDFMERYRELLYLRRESVLREGDFSLIETVDEILAYRWDKANEGLLFVYNLSGQNQFFTLERQSRLLMQATHMDLESDDPLPADTILEIPPYGYAILRQAPR